MRQTVPIPPILDSHVKTGGHIGPADSLLGIALRIKPVLTLKDNEVDMQSKSRTRSQLIHVMLDEIERCLDDRPVHIEILYDYVSEKANQLRRLVRLRFQCVEVLTSTFTPMMGVHTGPREIGLAYCPAD